MISRDHHEKLGNVGVEVGKEVSVSVFINFPLPFLFFLKKFCVVFVITSILFLHFFQKLLLLEDGRKRLGGG